MNKIIEIVFILLKVVIGPHIEAFFHSLILKIQKKKSLEDAKKFNDSGSPDDFNKLP